MGISELPPNILLTKFYLFLAKSSGMNLEIRMRDVVKDIFRELGKMSGFIPKLGFFKAQSLPIYNGKSSSDTLQHIALSLRHNDGSLERAGVLSPQVLFSESKDDTAKPILYFSITLDFLREFNEIAMMRYGQEIMLEIIRRHFEALNDRSVAVYFQYCNRFEYQKAALLAGGIPGWVTHRHGSGRSFRGVKGHLLCIMDRFLHHKNLRNIPQADLVKIHAKVMTDGGMELLIPKYFEEPRQTTLSFVRIWNCDLKYEYVYDMSGKFWIESVPESSRIYIEAAKKQHPERIITFNEVRNHLREYQRLLAE